MLQRIFYASLGCLQLLMCINWLFSKLRPMMDMAFFTHFWYSLVTLGSLLEGGAFSDLWIMSQRSIEAKSISILNIRRLNLSPYNLSMIIALSLSRFVIFCTQNAFVHFKFSNQIFLPQRKLRKFKSFK